MSAGKALMLIPLFLLVAAANPEQAAEYNTLGVEHYNASRWGEAVECFLYAYEMAPENETVRRNLSNAYMAFANSLAESGDLYTAIQQLNLAINADPANAAPLVQLGSYYLRCDEVRDAMYRLEEAVSLDPASIDAHDLLGNAYYRNNDVAAAIAEWEYVLELAPDRPGMQEKLDKAYREDGTESRYGRTSSRHFAISYAPDTKHQELSDVLVILERAYREIGQKLGAAYPPAPIQVIIQTAEDFSQVTLLGEHVGAVYDGKIRVPLQDAKGVAISEEELRRRLYHEYTHVVVRYLARDNVPWWVNEGLAETLSTQFSQQDRSLLEQAMQQKTLLPLSALVDGQLEKLDPEQLRVAYAQAHAAMLYLHKHFGQRQVTSFLAALGQGTAAEDALMASFRRNYALLDKDVTANLASLPR